MSEHDLLVWFNNGKVVALGVMMDAVLLPTPDEGEDAVDGNLVKPHCPVFFQGGLFHDAEIPGVAVDHDVPPLPPRDVYYAPARGC